MYQITTFFGKPCPKGTPIICLKFQEDDFKGKQCVFRFKPQDSNTKKKPRTYGWDELTESLLEVCESDKKTLKQEYTPIEVLGSGENNEYLVPWLSMRVGQSVTLKIDSRIKNSKQYQEITFDSNKKFNIIWGKDPENQQDPKEASTVTLECLRSSDEPTLLRLKADGKLAGGINVFHPEPKTVTVRCALVNMNDGDEPAINKKVDVDTLRNYFSAAFNPCLIDIEIVNDTITALDLLAPKNHLKKTTQTDIKKSLTDLKNTLS